jgi:hypothetical protein
VGGIYVSGTTFSGDFPTANAARGFNAGNGDAFAVRIAPAAPDASKLAIQTANVLLKYPH